MRGKDRTYQDVAQDVLKLCTRHLGRLGPGKRIGDGTFAGLRLALHLNADAADIVLVLRDIGEMGEISEGAHDLYRGVARKAVKCGFQLRSRGFIVIPAKLDRNLADALNSGEYRLALLLANDIAQKTAEQADILAQRQIATLKINDVHERPPPTAMHRQQLCKKRTLRGLQQGQWLGRA